MAFVAYDPILGEVDLSIVDNGGPGPFSIPGTSGATYGRNSQYFGELRGYDTRLGGGTFVYAAYGATIVAGTVVQFTESLSAAGLLITTATVWTGTANAGNPLGVAVAATGFVGNWGWFQVQGPAITQVSGTPTANTPVYWQASGVVSGTAVASKQMQGAQFASTNGITLGSGSSAQVLPNTQAVVLLQYPCGQDAIT
jgi:hypothetical protein